MIFHEMNSSVFPFTMNLIEDKEKVKIGPKKEVNEKAIDFKVFLKTIKHTAASYKKIMFSCFST
jgi:hypothetical protein